MANRKPLVINNGAVEQLQAADILDVSHDSLPDFVANEHIDHSGVSVTAGDGLTGGGTIETTKTLDLDIAKLSTVVIIAAGDYIPFEQISPSVTNKKITFANFESDLNHDNLTDFVANKHIDHTGVTVAAGTGLSGGGTIEANIALALSHLGIESLTDPGADRILFWDNSEQVFKWLTVGDYLTLSGTNLTANPGYVNRGDPSNWDIAESSLTLDGTWRDLSLAGFGVPVGAYAVQIRVFFKAATLGKFAGIRPNGNVYNYQQISQYTQSASTMEMQGIVPCDADRKVEYMGDANLTMFRFVVKGWLI